MSGKWIPSTERSLLVTFILSGNQIGSSIGLLFGGLLSDHVSWQSNFYVIGASGILFCIAWHILIFDSPKVHPRISKVKHLSKLIISNVQ